MTVTIIEDDGFGLDVFGSKLLLWGFEGAYVRDCTSGDLLFSLDEPCVSAVAAHSERIVLGTDEGVLSCWDGSTGLLIFRLSAHRERVTKVVVRDSFIYTSSLDGCLACWDLKSGERLFSIATGHSNLRTFYVHNGLVVTISPREPLVRCWDLESQDLIGEFSTIVFTTSHFFDGTLVLAGREVQAWDVIERTCVWEQAGNAVDMIVDSGSYLALASHFSGDVWVRRKADGSLVSTLQAHDGSVEKLYGLEDEKIVSAGGQCDGSVFVWDLSSQQKAHSFLHHEDRVTGLYYSPGLFVSMERMDESCGRVIIENVTF